MNKNKASTNCHLFDIYKVCEDFNRMNNLLSYFKQDNHKNNQNHLFFFFSNIKFSLCLNSTKLILLQLSAFYFTFIELFNYNHLC